jgi:hypothetical protein
MTPDPLSTALLDLDSELKSQIDLIVGGGYGLYLKQLHLRDHREIQTLFPLDDLPPARTTQDIDLILRADVVTSSASMRPIRAALDRLEFQVIESAKYMQFEKRLQVGFVKIDLLAGPLGEFADRVPQDPRRIKPQPSVKLHARRLDEAVGVEDDLLRIDLGGQLSSGEPHQAIVLIPQAFTYLLMKLIAFRDRLNDEDKQLGQHHALDLYRIVGLLTRDEDAHVRRLSQRFAAHAAVIDARRIVEEYFVPVNAIGRIRILEHQLASPILDLERFASELLDLLKVEQK